MDAKGGLFETDARFDQSTRASPARVLTVQRIFAQAEPTTTTSDTTAACDSQSIFSLDSKISRRDAQEGAAAQYEMRKKQRRERNRETRAGKLTVECLTKKTKNLSWLLLSAT